MTCLRRALCVAACIAALTGCSGASNSGGATTCGDFAAMNNDNRDAAVARMLKERNGRNSSTMDVINTRMKILDACEQSGGGDAKIGDLA